jgi:hypothetical protein
MAELGSSSDEVETAEMRVGEAQMLAELEHEPQHNGQVGTLVGPSPTLEAWAYMLTLRFVDVLRSPSQSRLQVNLTHSMLGTNSRQTSEYSVAYGRISILIFQSANADSLHRLRI